MSATAQPDNLSPTTRPAAVYHVLNLARCVAAFDTTPEAKVATLARAREALHLLGVSDEEIGEVSPS